MAIIYSYPINTNILATDIIIGSSTAIVNGRPKNQTKSFEIQDLAGFINAGNTLNSVLTNGNTSLLDAKIGELYLYDGPNGDYAKISIQDDLFSVIRATSGTAMFAVDNGNTILLNNGTANAVIVNPLTTSRTYTLPNATGTIALTSNIPATPTLQEVCDAGANVINAPILLEDLNAVVVLSVVSETATAISGQSADGIGIRGNTDNGSAVYGSAQAGYGGYFTSDNGVGLYASSIDGNGIFGYSANSNAGYFYSNSGTGVFGGSDASPGGYFTSAGSYSIVAAQSAAKPGGGSWTVYSDSRIKENIKPYEKGLSELLLVNPVNYEYNGLAGTEKGKEYIGIIAQEIKEIFPETVNTYKAKLNETDTEKTDLYDFNSSALTFALINAVKELNERIAILENK